MSASQEEIEIVRTHIDNVRKALARMEQFDDFDGERWRELKQTECELAHWLRLFDLTERAGGMYS